LKDRIGSEVSMIVSALNSNLGTHIKTDEWTGVIEIQGRHAKIS